MTEPPCARKVTSDLGERARKTHLRARCSHDHDEGRRRVRDERHGDSDLAVGRERRRRGERASESSQKTLWCAVGTFE